MNKVGLHLLVVSVKVIYGYHQGYSNMQVFL